MAEPMTLDAAAAAMRDAMQQTVRRHSMLFLIQGVLMVIAGVIALIYPLFTTAAVALMLGWLLIFSGVAQAVTLIGGSKTPHFWLQVISAALSIVVGFLFIRNPAASVATLVILMIVFFLVEGLAKVVFSLTVRPLANWGWVLASGVLGIVIAVWLLANPGMSLVFLGIFIGIQLIAEGAAISYMAWSVRRATRATA